jgi:DNA-binding winged helix-turn-helix (wHTH) protein
MNQNCLLLYHFEPFQLCPSERLLLRNGQPVDVTPRTFDTLVVLVKNAPNLVPAEVLTAAVWKVPEVEPAKCRSTGVLRPQGLERHLSKPEIRIY